MTAPVDLVIFDCDGVLVDSEFIAGQVLSTFLAERGLDLSPLDCQHRFMGKSLESVKEQIETEHTLALPDDFPEQIRARDKVKFETDLTAIDGFPDVFARLDVPFCVASSGSMEKMQTTLGLTGLWAYVHPRIYSARLVGRSKPWPDLFLHAARDMGVTPENCLVIEDSPTGVEAGKRAGMTVWGFTGGKHCGEDHAARLRDAGAVRTFDDMRTLPDLIIGLSCRGA